MPANDLLHMRSSNFLSQDDSVNLRGLVLQLAHTRHLANRQRNGFQSDIRAHLYPYLTAER